MSHRPNGAQRLLAGTSIAAIILGLTAAPAHAQLAAMRAAAGTIAPPIVAPVSPGIPARSMTMQDALARQLSLQTRAQALATYVTSAKSAALASIRATPTEGISNAGLNPIQAVRAATIYVAAGVDAATVRGNAAPLSVAAVNDPTGQNTWEGSLAPVQSTASNERVTVRIDQTQQRSLLSWQNFDVGTNTALVFNQKLNGVAQKGWTVVNRVANATRPSTILGSVTADGTVLVLNRSGVLFGPQSQVNLHSLVASSLELGNFASSATTVGASTFFNAATLKERVTGYLQNGLLVQGVSGFKGQLLSSSLAAGQYDVNRSLPLAVDANGNLNPEGDVLVYQGATITTDSGGFIILAGPTVQNAGTLSAIDGQVSLQGGRFIGAVTSTGAIGSADENVRGLILSSQLPNVPLTPQAPTPDQGVVTNSGLIVSRRGYISLGTDLYGQVTNDGLLSATTSVSRNGKILLTGGTVRLAGSNDHNQASGITILPDDSAETIPQGSPTSPPAFKSSQIAIGNAINSYLVADGSGDVALMPTMFSMETNSFILAPNAKVVIGHDVAAGVFQPNPGAAASVTIADKAIIDVSGVKGVARSAGDNSVRISPAKQNELRDTPNYRPVRTDGGFTLNGATLFVDARASGVRDDGVAWVGSPLLEAASAVSQIPVSAAELMTRGGNISIDVGSAVGATNLLAIAVPPIIIAKGAIFDISGGWTTYSAGFVETTQLLTRDGRVVGIDQADPNDVFVDIVNGFTATQTRLGISQTFNNAALRGQNLEDAYDEGRDAGALQIGGSQMVFDATVHANAFAGSRQLASAIAPSRNSAIAGDPRKLQFSKGQLPSGGLLRIGSFSGSSGVGFGQDIVVYRGLKTGPADVAELLLDERMLSNAGLSGLVLQTSGAVSLTAATDRPLTVAAALAITGDTALQLADGGVLEIDAGRQIRLNGNVRIAGGTVAARTYQLSDINAAGISTVGNPFRSDDDILVSYASGTALPNPFDLTVNGTLSVAGKWVNDYLTSAIPQGAGWINGGSIALTVAPKVIVPVDGDLLTASAAADISGSIRINAGALLDVSAGAFVSNARRFNLSASGGNISLINETTYATVAPLQNNVADLAGSLVRGQSVAFTPKLQTPTTIGVTPSLVPISQTSEVKFAPGTLRGFGFAGGGTFKLVSPNVAIGSVGDPGATFVPLDFLQTTGFGALDLTTYRSRIVRDLFDNGSTRLSAFLETTRFVVGAGQTLDLTQITLPDVLDAGTQGRLLTLASGESLTGLLTPSIPTALWYRRSASLLLRGLTELSVEAGGSIIGAPQAVIIAPKLYNAGRIDLPSGTIQQIATLPEAFNLSGIGLSDNAAGGSGFDAVFGPRGVSGRYTADGLNAAGLQNADGSVKTNNEIFTTPGNEQFLYFLGRVAANDGIVLAAGSITNLAGIAIINPDAPLRADGTRYTFGRLLAGGSITTAAASNPSNDATQAFFPNPSYGVVTYPDPTSTSPSPPPLLAQTAPRRFVARLGSVLDISGATGTFDVAVSANQYAPSLQWSDAGLIALRGGGTLSGATIRARGGNSSAAGGTLEWLTPTIRAADNGLGTNNVAFADGIARAGFDTLIASGGLTLDGAFTLSLGKALLVRSPVSLDGTPIGPNADVTISATLGTIAAIEAPYIVFASRSGFVRNSAAANGDAVVTFAAGALGMDLFGSTLFDRSIAQTNLTSAADVRLIGVDDRADTTQAPVLNGSLVSAGNLTFDAARVYTTTGTGNLQRILENAAGATNTRTPLPFQLSALGASTITFLGNRINTAAPLSAGSFLQINARNIVQNGYLAAPLGRIAFGSAENPVGMISFGANSVTAVSGAGLNVPYGTTTDLSQLFFTPGSASPLTQLPSGNLRVIADTIDFAAGSKVIGSGGGDVFAFEFVSGTGGSRDVLSRFNSDVFSSNGFNSVTGQGLQYADGRQVYALVPSIIAAKIALTDPVYSADYGLGSPTDLYGTSAGLAVTLDGGGGLAAGQYVLMPAHYALLPGAYRIVENVDAVVPAIGSTQTLLDGSTVLGGVYSTAGTNLVSSQRRSFTLQSQASFLRYSSIRTTGGTATIQRAAASAGITAPRLPLDAARVVLDPLRSLTVAGFFDMTPAAGGRGSTVDILGESIFIDRSGASNATGLVLSSRSLANLNANSLMIGGERIENADGTTRLGITASRITVASGADIQVPELILAVAGSGSNITIRDGASIIATGTLADTRAGDYVIPSTSNPVNGDPFDQSGVGSVFRLSAGPQRAVSRLGAFAAANAGRNSQLNIGRAVITGNSLLLNTNFRFSIDDAAALSAPLIAISASNLSFGERGTISSALEQQIARAAELHLSTAAPITFDAGTVHTFNRLSIDAAGIALTGQTGGSDTLTINAGDTRISNSRLIADAGCTMSGITACGTTGNILNLNLASLTLGSGSFDTYSFDGAVNLTARAGTYIVGSGALQANGAALMLATPFVIDRAAVVDLNNTSTTPSDQITPRGNYTIPITPDYNFATKGTVLLTAAGTTGAGTTGASPAGLRAPGAHISFGAASAPVAAITIDGTAITATSGVIDIRSNGAITLAGAASLATPGFSRKFGDDQSTTTISAGAGTVNLVSLTSNIVLPATSSLITDTGIGNAGRLNLYAAQGAIDLRAALNAAVTGARAGSFTFDAGTSAFDLDGFALTNARKFQGDISIRSGAGNLALSSGHILKAANASLTADGGSIIVGGTIDTSGASVTGLTPSQLAVARISGGNVALWGRDGVALNAGALIDTHTSGYADNDQRQASAGDVTIGIGNTGGAIAINAGATIDLGARRTQAALAANTSGNRLVRVTVKDADTLVNTDVFQFVSADQGGELSLRAPIIGDAMDKIDVRLKGAVIGASSRQIEAYRRYDLDVISGLYDGISSVGRLDVLDPTPTGFNILSNVFVDSFDGTQSIPYFIQNFAVSAADGSDLGGIRLRPGVDLVSSRSIFTVAAWNLAAGTLNVSGARAAGLIIDLPQLGPRPDGSAYYALKPGSESEILSNHVSFLYRVGGKPSGEAGVFTIKAANNIDVIRSISDGFFNFADKLDAAYINYQLGGGDRAYNVGLLTSCGSSLNCADVANFADINAGTQASANNTVTINLSRFLTGREQGAGPALAPYSPEANLATALGNNLDPISGDTGGDALGFAQLFPRLTDGSAIHSSSLRLVAGSGTSVNPLHIDRASAGNLTVRGETAYALTATRGTASIGTGIDLKLAIAGLTNAALPAYGLDELLDTTDGNGNVNALTGDSYTQITWGGAPDGGLAGNFRVAAQRFFTSGNAQFMSNPRGVVEGVAAPLADMLAFLQTVAANFAQNVAGQTPGYPIGVPVSPPVINFGARAATSRTLIRTGDGSIAVAASGNIDLRNGAVAVYRNENGATVSAGGGAQVGGTAIYTAGVRLSAQAVTARVAETGEIVSITPQSNYLGFPAQDLGFLPSPKGLDDQAAVLADGGGSLWVQAGGSVLARRDEWSERFLNRGAVISGSQVSSYNRDAIGDTSQRWRPGAVGQDTEIAIAPKYFTSGLGTLAGGDITLAVGESVNDLTLALDAATTTTRASSGIGAVSLTLGHGDLSATIGGDLGAGQIDVANGAGQINVSGNVVSFGRETQNTTGNAAQYLRIRLARANVALAAQGAISLAGVSALGAARSDNSAGRYNQAGFFTPTSSFSAIATGELRYVNNRLDQIVPFQIGTGGAGAFGGSVLPPTLTLAALTSTLSAPSVPLLLYPSKTGNLQLFSAGDLASLVITMSDSDPSLLAGAFSAARINLDSINATGAGNVAASAGLGFGIPGVGPTTSEFLLRLYHNENTTHAGDFEPARIFAGNDIRQSLINVPKAVQVLAGRDIVNLFFTGQNANAQDTTIISAARDITSTTATSTIDNLPYLVSNNFILGGGGNLVVQAGRDIGPFINSAVVKNVSYAGGIQTVGNFYNPWLSDGGANLSVLFGVAGGIDYAALRETYLNPANAADLDKALFVLKADSLGITRPDRSKPIYSANLAKWLESNDPVRFAEIFGSTTFFVDEAASNAALAAAGLRFPEDFVDTTAGYAALNAAGFSRADFPLPEPSKSLASANDLGNESLAKTRATIVGNALVLAAAAYPQAGKLYAAFTQLDPLLQNQFLRSRVLFNELAQPAQPDGPSFLQYYRSYRAVQTLFPVSSGYTDNLAVYTTDPTTVSADSPQGLPTRNLVNGQPQTAQTVATGNADLRLATIQTVNGGDLSILGPGGNFIAGSVVRTSTQVAQRVTRFGVDQAASLAYGQLTNSNAERISAIPIGFEGVLTLNGGVVNGFVDGNFLVNQSRVFTQAGGDITLFSSNGDLNAGQGPRSASNFPPVTVRFNLDGFSQVDSAGSVSGAGIGAFQRRPTDPTSSIILVAPAGEVDAGDAGVRATGNVLVAAARVANSDAFSAGGSISGVPGQAAAPVTVAPTSAASAVASQNTSSTSNNDTSNRRSIISVDVLGFTGGGVKCEDGSNDPNCPPAKPN